MEILWEESKNELLKSSRGVSFEMVVQKIIEHDFIGPEHNPDRPGQFRILVELNEYPHVVPLIIDENGDWFLKTIYPSRIEKRRFYHE
jgi:uncharacterized DUF497 family protein